MSSASFAKQLKNNLDKTLVKNISSIENGQELNIEDTVNLVFNEFNQIPTEITLPQKKKFSFKTTLQTSQARIALIFVRENGI